MKTALFVALAILCAGCIGQNDTSEVAKTGDTVSVYYTLMVDGTLMDSNAGKQALTFEIGAGQMIVGFEKGIIGMKAGEEKTFSVSPEEGYGPAGSGHQLAGKTLVFTVKVDEINPVVE